jgi:tetratricopeptide (TPR) repeat protein
MANPITARLDQLQAHWRRFGDDDRAAVLRWVMADPQDLPLVQAFFDVEDSEAAVFPDLFLKLESPFDNRATYGRALALELTLRYRQMRPGLAEGGAVTGWGPPARAAELGDVGRLYQVAASFHAYHEPLFRRVALYLAPRQIADLHAWQGWLERAVVEHERPEVRLVVLDDGRAPLLATVGRSVPGRVRSEPVSLGLSRALEEISQQAGGLETFGGKFRHLYLQTGSAWGAGDPARAEELGAEALSLAELAAWPSLACAVHYLMGSGYLGQQQPVEAARRFQRAEQAAIDAQERGDPGARTLRLDARLALGAVLVSQNAFARAAHLYEETAPLAAQPDSAQLHIECWRMAGYAYERDGQMDKAWESLLKALAVGNVLDAEARRATTLPFVGEALLRLSRSGRYTGVRDVVEENLRWLLGDDWRAQARARSPETIAS